ncbi:MAG: proton-translocating transhydrogenase family protein [Pirellulaceae bacterium]
MKQPLLNYLSFAIPTATIVAVFLAMLAPSSRAQTSSKSGAEKIGAAAQPSSAAKTGDKAAEKPTEKATKAEPPKTPAPSSVKETTEKVTSATADEPATAVDEVVDYSALLFVFVMATIIGLGVVARVSRLLHTPLMSLTNAISAIAIVGAIIVTGSTENLTIRIMGAIALFASMTNVVSGFLITDRMLKMFKQTRTEKK